MADNVAAKSDASATVATLGADDIGGIHYVRNKIIIGADGTNDGDVSASNPLPVKGTGTAGTANSGVVTIQGIASMTAVQIADNGGSLTVDNGGTFAVQVDGTALTRLTDIETNTDSNAVVGGGTEATAQRVTIATDSTGVLSVDDNGSSLTVDGTVTANAGTNLNTSALAVESGGNLAGAATSLAIIDDWDETDRAKVNPIVGQAGVAAGAGAVGATVQRTTLASDDPAVTSLAIIDDWDESDRCKTNSRLEAHTSGGLSIFRSLDIDETEEDVKTSAGQVYGWYIFNASTSIRYVKFYNATAANVTVGTTTPVITVPVPAATSGGIGFVTNSAMGIAFDTAICVAATTGLADNDTGAPSANDVVIQIFFK